MPPVRLSLPLIALVLAAQCVLIGCGKSRLTKPDVAVTTPEDGGEAGNGFESNWTDAYADAARQTPSVATTTPTPRTTSPPRTSPPMKTRPSTPTPSPKTAKPLIGKSIAIDKLAPTLEPVVVRVSMTKRNGEVVQGAGVVVRSSGVVLTAASLLEDAIAGEVEFCNRQKTRVLGHFDDTRSQADEIAPIAIDTHGYELEAVTVDSTLAHRRTPAQQGNSFLCFDARGFPFSPQRVVAQAVTSKPRSLAKYYGVSEKYDEISTNADADLTQPGSPWFDSEGRLIAMTIDSPRGRNLIGVAIKEIGTKINALQPNSATKYTGTPGTTPPAQETRPASPSISADLPTETIARPTTAIQGSTVSISRRGLPAVKVDSYKPIDTQQRFLHFTMSRNGKWAAAIYNDGKIYVYDLQGKKVAAVISATQGNYLDCAFYGYDDKLMTLRPRQGAGDRPLACWDLKKLQMLGNWSVDVDAQKVVVAYNDQFVAVADARGSAMTLRFRNSSMSTYEKSPVVASADPGAELTVLATAPSSRYLVLGFADGKVSILGVIGDRIRKLTDFQPHPDAEVRDIAFSANGAKMATCSDDGSVRFWEKWQADFRSNPINLKEDGKTIHSITIGYRERLAIGASTASGAILWDTESKSVLDRFDSSPPAIQVELSEAANKLAIISADGSFKIWPIKGPGS
ncbi:WD40 repeat domain-containing protein [Blastopirellula retiformator]|uniref:WD domain, G-beta repeat n=1 Tax=Blastopirellula retiformator TaxID=2527970 RepID=A0A5C5V2X5_9BACT|nr:trypsin-like peptidase domain-containing protein [Blastopirellula retiformator]TWT32045.1 WD domain, G-beta repeat [Blastopirellula retiformator]